MASEEIEAEKKRLLTEIKDVESELRAADDSVYQLVMKRKLLKHRLYDLEYDLEHGDSR